MSNEDGFKIEDVRAKVTETQKKELIKIAEQFKCTYGTRKSPSISGLLQGIAEKELIVINNKEIDPERITIQLNIEVIANLIGIVEKVSRVIADLKINIVGMSATENSNIANIYIQQTEKIDLMKLTQELYKIKISDVFEKNSSIYEKLELISEKCHPINLPDLDDLSELIGDEDTIETVKIKLTETGVLKKRLIRRIYYIFKFRFLLDNREGTLNDVVKNISGKNISIAEMKIVQPKTYHGTKNHNLVDLTLGFYPSRISEVNTLSKINEIKNLIEKSQYVEERVILVDAMS